MKRISTSTRAVDLFGAGKDGWKDGSLGVGVLPTDGEAAWFNGVQEELIALVESAGIAPSGASLNQVAQALQSGKLWSATAGGTADAITAAFSIPVPALKDGMTLYVRAASANATTTPTFTPNTASIAAKQMVKGAGSPLTVADIAGAGHWLCLQYDLALDKWVLLNPSTGVTSNTPLPGFRNRLMNGNFRIAQRGTSGVVNSGYTLDRWRLYSGGTALNWYQSAGVTPGKQNNNFLQISGAVGNTATTLLQRLEAQDSQDLAGKTVTVSFWLYQTTGSNMTPVVGVRYAAAGTDNFSTTSARVSAPTQVVPTASWVRCTASLVVPTAATTGLELSIDLTAISSGQAAFICDVQMELGATATTFETLPLQLELAMCQRYFLSLSAGTLSAQGTAGGAGWYVSGGDCFLPVRMRATPTVVAPTWSTSFTGTPVITGVTQDGFTHYAISTATGGASYSSTSATTFSAEL